MTVTTTHFLTIAVASGLTDTFTFDFQTQLTTDIVAYIDETEDATAVVTLNADQEASPGGSVQLSSTPAANKIVKIQRELDDKQLFAYPEGGSFPSGSHEDAMDKMTMTLQDKNKLTEHTRGVINLATKSLVDFTGIPEWAKRITITLSSITYAAANVTQLQLGDGGGLENTGYYTVQSYAGTSGGSGVAAQIGDSEFDILGDVATLVSGEAIITLTLANPEANTWIMDVNYTTLGVVYHSKGQILGLKTLTSVLDRVRLLTSNGPWSSGLAKLYYE